MLGAKKPFVIALEEHYMDPGIRGGMAPRDVMGGPLAGKLEDLLDIRIKEMDQAGVDVQVLSQAAPAVQRMDGPTATRLAREANDRLAETCLARPDRLTAFAALPTPDPKAAADELERAVTKLGFKGAMVHGLTNGLFLDDKQFWPIFERAAALGVPIYLHPAMPHQAVVDAYYKDYVKDWPIILSAAWGFTVETATAGIRMVLSGVFDKYPELQIILGHLGEGVPFYLERITESLSRDLRGRPLFRDTFTNHFHVTTSGFFSDPALTCCITEMGIDRVMLSIDYPFVPNAPGVEWMDRFWLNAADKEKVFSGNAKRLLKM